MFGIHQPYPLLPYHTSLYDLLSIPEKNEFFAIIYLQQGRTRRQSELQLCSSSKLPLPNDCNPNDWEYEFTIADRNGNYKVTCTLDQSGDQNCDRDVPDLYCSIICVQPKCPWLLNPQLTK